MKQKKVQKKAPSEPLSVGAPKAATQVERDVERMMATPGLAGLIADPAAREHFNGLALAPKVDPLMTGVMLEAGKPSVDWEARCRAAEAALEQRLRRCGERGCNDLATWSNGPYHVCDAHAEECLDRWRVDTEDELRAWLALREKSDV